jgi:hypothetical protein
LLLAAMIVLLALSRNAGAAQSQPNQFPDLDTAIAAGRLDPAVRDALRTTGVAEALLVLADAPVRAQVEADRARRGKAQDDDATLAEKRRQFAALKQQALAAAGSAASVLRDYEQFGVQHLRVQSEQALLALLNRPQVQAVRQNEPHQLRLSSSLPLINQPTAQANGKTGAGTAVAVLDTGVDYTRSAFGPCSVPNVPATPGGTCAVVHAADFAPEDVSRRMRAWYQCGWYRAGRGAGGEDHCPGCVRW